KPDLSLIGTVHLISGDHDETAAVRQPDFLIDRRPRVCRQPSFDSISQAHLQGFDQRTFSIKISNRSDDDAIVGRPGGIAESLGQMPGRELLLLAAYAGNHQAALFARS